ncbi:hypothetical protein BUALT_Bualt03G0225200 [Buddleja alternifolia]|uniref:GBF-interacting protein 1 N-terminal domain-containing protein n=1 Tax=Buddleja alternifolia TaxID=168488 RepID=A0AAV6Y364_9LAMI|nr:hypothetical protein BUALT_Bualt03G0225200 [Buddleja alternifolia]
MSSGGKGGAIRVSIPSGVKKMIENIKEITGQNHSEDEIYAMLKECSMDPNETAQKLLLLDTFHEVKSKRDRKKEVLALSCQISDNLASYAPHRRETEERMAKLRCFNIVYSYWQYYSPISICSCMNYVCSKLLSSKQAMAGSELLFVLFQNLNKEPAELKWKPGNQARTNRVGRGNYAPRYMSHDAGSGRNAAAEKEKATSKAPLATANDVKKNETTPVASQIAGVSNGPSGITTQSTKVMHHAGEGAKQSSATGNASMSKLEGPPSLTSPIDSFKKPIAPWAKDIQQHKMLDLSNSGTSIPSAPASRSYFSSSDHVTLPSQDVPLPDAVGSTRRELESQRTPVELISDDFTGSKPASARISTPEDGIKLQEKIPDDFQEVGKNQNLESLHAASSTVAVSTISRPSSNYNNRPQVIGPQKVGPGKEWKPKSANPSTGQGASTAASSEISVVSVGSHPESQTTLVVASKEATLELQRKLEDSHISEHVIIPNHLHVPEVEKLGFCFGSFDASFGLEINQNGVPGSDKSPPLSESSEAIDEPVKELESSNQTAVVAADDTQVNYSDHPQSPSQGLENFSSDMVEVPSSVTPDYSESKEEVAPGSHQHPMVNTTSNYNFGFMPPVLSNQLTSLESSESQARDAPRHPGFVVQQSFDPASYYAQFYRSGMDSDGRISPFHSAGAANKYNGNAALVSAQPSQTPQELQGGVPLVLSTASPTPLVTQPAGVMQSSITPTQQPLPVFRQPPGVHLPHYNYIPYGPYFSPFYVPPPAIHQFLANGGAFPQQPQTGNLYPTPPPGTTAKYSVSQYKQGSNTGSSGHMGVPGSYGPYGLSMANYSTSSASAAVTPTSNEDLNASQVKENNIYVSGQQNEGSGVWFTAPSRDMSTLQASSFYNLPQGHQLAFTPTQPGHGPFPGIFHPAQAVTAATVHPLLQQSQAITSPGVDMVGPTGNVYQQQPPQHAQINWPSNY